MKINITKNTKEFKKIFPVVKQLRTSLSEKEFIERVKNQENQFGYKLVFLEDKDKVRAVAGFRISNNLAWGKFCYVDDFVTDGKNRKKGYGSRLFDWIIKYASSRNCDSFHLDSGVQRFEAHKFYLNKGLSISSHHFSLHLK